MDEHSEIFREVRKAVREIKAIKYDCEAAHSQEDALYVKVLSWIAKNSSYPAKDLAKEALGAAKIDFSRWCA